ncbi:conserved hypothetical protein [Bradyrhizobium sp. ORS 285]|nr:conserved hypothetical protein [Bradyrhizobium sp. ORS 285]
MASCQPCPVAAGNAEKKHFIREQWPTANPSYATALQKQVRCYFSHRLVLSAAADQAPCNRMKLPGDIT